jgi:hypothetical protein
MANTVKLKRSAVTGRVPTTSDLALGELALNTFDGNLFFKKDASGTESILAVATLTGTQTLTNKTLTSPTITGGALSGTFSGAVAFSDTTVSTSTTTGALKLAGGLGIAGTLNAASVRVNDAYTLPTSDGISANVMITNGAGQLSFVDVNDILTQSGEVVNLTTNQDFGLLTANVLQSADLGEVSETAEFLRDWGFIATIGVVYPDQLVLPNYTVSVLPSSELSGQMIYISNESGGAVIAFSDGTNWRRVTDRVIVS